jgi:hypothetical protein
MTYNDTSEKSTISVSDCPIPEVSSTTRSNPAAFTTSRVVRTAGDSARLACRVANERM